jgi:hypothetical protein
MRRVERDFPSVMIISDRHGLGALNAIRAYAVTYPAEAHSEDYAPGAYRGSIASVKL